MHQRAGVLALLLVCSASAHAAEVADWVRRIKSVGGEGAGNVEAAAAWRELSRQGPETIVTLLAALDDASPLAANWLRSAIDSIVEREAAARRPLPTKEIDAFLKDKRHAGPARRLAFELLCKADPSARERLLPTFLDDSSLELRFEAISAEFDRIKALPKESTEAAPHLRRLLDVARDVAQTEEIAKELDKRGSPVDLVKHFALITSWYLASGFDNTDGKGFPIAYPPEKGADATATYRKNNGQEIAWKPHTTVEKTGAVDLNKAVGKEKNVVAYGFVEIDAPAARKVEVRAASATALKIWVNGKEVLARETYHQSFDQDAHVGSAVLRAGRNSILIKVCQNDQKEDWAQNWMYQVRLTDEFGAGIPVKILQPAPTGQRQDKP